MATLAVELAAKAREVLEACQAGQVTLAVAESCTGGLVSAALTDMSGSSTWFERGFVTYSNIAKTELLGVPAGLIETHGAVSEAVARAMAEGALAHSQAQVSVAITGIAGPTGGSPEKPVGLVHFAAARRDRPTLHDRCLFGPADRDAVRRMAALHALDLLIRRAREDTPPQQPE